MEKKTPTLLAYLTSSVKQVIKFLLKEPKNNTTKCLISLAFIPPFNSISFLILSALLGQQSHSASPDKCLGLRSGTQSSVRQQGHKRIKQPSNYCITLKGTEVNIYAFFCCIISVKKADSLKCGMGE